MRRRQQVKFTQTWMTTLEDVVKGKEGIDLTVAYYCDMSSYEPPFDFDGVHYYPIVNKGGSYIAKFRERVESQEERDKILLKRLSKVVDDVQPDIIHIHGTESNFGLLTGVIDNIPLVISLQGIISPIVERYYSGIPQNIAVKCDTWKDYLHQINEKKVFSNYCHAAKREQKILSQSKYVIGRTQWDKEILSLMAPKAKYYVVNEILREGFRNNIWLKLETKDAFIITSTLSNGIYKGYETVLRCAKILKKMAPFQFEWRIIGCTEQYKYVKAAILLTGISPKEVGVSFLGSKKEDEMFVLLKETHLYVQTSHIENSPNALCEAMVMGMPCVASNVGGTATMLKDGVEGLLYPDGDPYILASTIVKAKSSYDSMLALGETARKKALERHDKYNVAAELFFAYNKVIGDFANEK